MPANFDLSDDIIQQHVRGKLSNMMNALVKRESSFPYLSRRNIQIELYRVTIQLVANLPLASKPKFHFGLARLGQARQGKARPGKARTELWF